MKNEILILFALLALYSCDVVYYVAVNNYGQTSRVTVHYDHSNTSFWTDSDTLTGKLINGKAEDTLLIRSNIDATSYRFTAPTGYQIELKPKSLGTPITSVTYETGNDSTLTVDLYGKNWRLLKRQGIIEIKSTLFFPRAILINKQ